MEKRTSMEIIQEMVEHGPLGSPQFAEMLEKANGMQAQWDAATVSIRDHLDWMRKLPVMNPQQIQAMVSIVHDPKMLAAVLPAINYLRRERPDLYQEIQTPGKASDMPKAPHLKKKSIRRRTRTLQKASRLIIRSGNELTRLDEKLQSMSATRLSFLLTALGSFGDAMPSSLEHSVHVLVFVLTILLIVNYECHNHDDDTE